VIPRPANKQVSSGIITNQKTVSGLPVIPDLPPKITRLSEADELNLEPTTPTTAPKSRSGRASCVPSTEIALSKLSGLHLGVLKAQQTSERPCRARPALPHEQDMTPMTSVDDKIQNPSEEVDAQNRHTPITPLPKMQLCT
jgi:hypothetical protein